jgi:hypothetical protein
MSIGFSRRAQKTVRSKTIAFTAFAWAYESIRLVSRSPQALTAQVGGNG